MIKSLVELNKTIDEKVDELVKRIKEADPTTKEFTTMMDNFGLCMTISGNVARILENVARAGQAEEAKKDESNN